MKAGVYLGGVRSIECIRQRSFVDSETGCWHWRGDMSDCARVHFKHPETGKVMKSTCTRAVLILRTGKSLPPEKKAYRTCESRDCVSPDHIAAMTRDEHGAWVVSRGIWKNQPNRITACRKNRRKGAKLDMDKAREIRASDLTHKQLSEIYGIAASTIGFIKIGKLWKEPAGSVFGWRP